MKVLDNGRVEVAAMCIGIAQAALDAATQWAKTRVIVGLDMRPQTLSARLMIQSLKFAKANLYKRFEARVERFGKDIQEQYNRENGIRI